LEGVDVFLVVDVVVLDFGFAVGFFAIGFLTVVGETLGLALVVDVGFLVVVDLGFAVVVVVLVVFDLVVEEAGFGLAAVLDVGLF
jgi:hypothetical protein